MIHWILFQKYVNYHIFHAVFYVQKWFKIIKHMKCIYFICIQIKIDDEICSILIEILTVLLRDELVEGYAVGDDSNV